MDFDSPDVEDFPGLYASEGGVSKKKEESDYSEGDHEKLSKKDLLIGRRKDKKDKKDRGYAALEGESSPEEVESNPSKSAKKSKAFKFSSSKNKEKREKSREKDKLDKDVKDKDEIKETKEKEKKKDKEKKDKDKKEKSKEKEKKEKKIKQTSASEEVLELGDVQPVFGVSVSLATERSRCHDGIDIPLIVRDCIDFLQEHGLQSDQIYKVDPIKTRLQYLKRLYNNRENQTIEEMDIPTACGLLKLFLRELPEPILTTDLIERFEEVASHPQVTKQEQELQQLLQQLPSYNKTLLSWILLHFDSIIQNEKSNKMNAQSLAMLLSPSLQMSHRLLVALLIHCSNLFPDVKLLKYVPPITATSPKLPETSNDIQNELRKQESLLNQIHSEMNAGFVSKKREEQLWEVQRIITQLKRKLRSFEKKTDKIGDSINNLTTTKITKLSGSDDESIKTVTMPSTESAATTGTKNTPQEAIELPAIIPEEQIVNDSPINLQPSPENQKISNEGLYIDESGLLMTDKSHSDYYTLIRLQLENQELMNWKNQLQSKINTERTETLKLKQLYQQQQMNMGNKILQSIICDDNADYEKIIETYIRENTLLEQKKKILAKELFDEKKELILMQVELAMLDF